ncbi:MAG TPA: hypothetical protein VE377_07665 [Candidatus Dormibacteraeota bacterium]|nr:hypothetical protein [Candidatus Dormibacteraeota bacterium]
MDKDERIELLHKFFRQLLRTATESLDSIDMLKLGIPEEQEVARLLETFTLAVETSKEIERYVAAGAHPVVEVKTESAPEAIPAPGKWRTQDDTFGMR